MQRTPNQSPYLSTQQNKQTTKPLTSIPPPYSSPRIKGKYNNDNGGCGGGVVVVMMTIVIKIIPEILLTDLIQQFTTLIFTNLTASLYTLISK